MEGQEGTSGHMKGHGGNRGARRGWVGHGVVRTSSHTRGHGSTMGGAMRSLGTPRRCRWQPGGGRGAGLGGGHDITAVLGAGAGPTSSPSSSAPISVV